MPKQDRNIISVIQKLHDRLILIFSLWTKFLTLDNIALALFNLTATLLICSCQFKFSSILMPRYFTEFVVYNLLPFNFNFKVASVCFLTDLKRTTSVLLKLRQILLALSQFERYFKSWPTCLFTFLMELLKFWWITDWSFKGRKHLHPRFYPGRPSRWRCYAILWLIPFPWIRLCNTVNIHMKARLVMVRQNKNNQKQHQNW